MVKMIKIEECSWNVCKSKKGFNIHKSMDPISRKEEEDRELSQIFNKLTNYKVYPERFKYKRLMCKKEKKSVRGYNDWEWDR